MTELSEQQKKEWAKLLFTRHDETIPQIALKVGEEEAVIRDWVHRGGWQGMKRSLITAKSEQLNILYDILERHTATVKDKPAAELNTKDADLMIKYTTAIKNLERDTSVGEVIDVAKMFCDWLQPRDPEFRKLVVAEFDVFIKLKKK